MANLHERAKDQGESGKLSVASSRGAQVEGMSSVVYQNAVGELERASQRCQRGGAPEGEK